MDNATILVVCTGNIRRSPAIELMLRQGSTSLSGLDGSGVAVTSAGVRALVGEPIDPLVERELRARGVSAGEHAARQLTAELVLGADLVVTAEREHRAAVVRLAPEAVKYTFTLRELTALGGMVGRGALGGAGIEVPERIRELVRRGPLERATRRVRRPENDDIPDLRRRTGRSARRLVTDVQSSVDALLQILAPEPALTIVGPPAADEEDDTSDADPVECRSAG